MVLITNICYTVNFKGKKNINSIWLHIKYTVLVIENQCFLIISNTAFKGALVWGQSKMWKKQKKEKWSSVGHRKKKIKIWYFLEKKSAKNKFIKKNLLDEIYNVLLFSFGQTCSY